MCLEVQNHRIFKNQKASNAGLPSELLSDAFKHHDLLQWFEGHLVCWILKVKCRVYATVPGSPGETYLVLGATQS